MQKTLAHRNSWKVSDCASDTYAPEEAPEEPVHVEEPIPAIPVNGPVGVGEYVDRFSAAGIYAVSDLVVVTEPFLKVCMR